MVVRGENKMQGSTEAKPAPATRPAQAPKVEMAGIKYIGGKSETTIGGGQKLIRGVATQVPKAVVDQIMNRELKLKRTSEFERAL